MNRDASNRDASPTARALLTLELLQGGRPPYRRARPGPRPRPARSSDYHLAGASVLE
jgi:hypothetical protein